jgi:hypothetical protein
MNQDHRKTWETYAGAWKAADRKEKLSALEMSTEANCVYRDPLACTEGHATLTEYMRKFHQQVPGGYFETTYFLAHNQRSVAKWNMRNGEGVVVSEGISYGEYGPSGKLVAMTGFFETPPQ